MSNVDRIKHEKASLKEQIQLKNSVERLMKNRDYIKVIEKAFMETDCARYARISGLNSRTEEERQDALAKSQAAGHLAEYLHTKIMMGTVAEGSLNSLNENELDIVQGE